MRIWVLPLVLICLPGLGAAQDATLLDRPGAVWLMRHALAPGTGDPAAFMLGDCTTQRNLSADGRDQARRIGAALRHADIRPTHIFTSEWCRARETADRLGLGDVTPLPALNSHFAGRGDQAAQAGAVMRVLAELPENARPLLVTHQVNISALSGTYARSGEIVVTTRDENGQLAEAGRFLIEP
ncbi:histidine phosphatase family protein [Roseovarius sp. S4756]|uniref:histidine phosphatase family protein n=1 Tax=Roseovarius maritimus TaxID=3342637 RepID=UPI00372C0F06